MSSDQDFQEHLEPKPCKFCGQAAAYKPLPEMEAYNAKVYFCERCNAEYLYWPNASLASVSLYTKISGKLYRWTVTHTGGTLWFVKNPGIPGTRANKDLQALISFNEEIPYITPETVNSKIKTWLIFS